MSSWYCAGTGPVASVGGCGTLIYRPFGFLGSAPLEGQSVWVQHMWPTTLVIAEDFSSTRGGKGGVDIGPLAKELSSGAGTV